AQQGFRFGGGLHTSDFIHLHFTRAGRPAVRLNPGNSLLNLLVGRGAAEAGICTFGVTLEVLDGAPRANDTGRPNIFQLGFASCPSAELEDYRQTRADAFQFEPWP